MWPNEGKRQKIILFLFNEFWNNAFHILDEKRIDSDGDIIYQPVFVFNKITTNWNI